MDDSKVDYLKQLQAQQDVDMARRKEEDKSLGLMKFGMGLLSQDTPEEKRRKKSDEFIRALGDAAKDYSKKASGMKKGGKVSSASKRADGCAVRGKTKGRMV